MATLYSAVQATPDASETVEGKLRIATNAEGLAGTDDTTAMTPLKTANAIAASASGVTGGLVYRGSYDASLQTPDLTTASKGDFYIVGVAGSLAAQVLNIGDHVVFNQDASSPITSAMFDIIDNTDAVTSVNSQTGVVNLTATDVSALASGDNISELTNDSGYITSSLSASITVDTDGAYDLGTESAGFDKIYGNLDGAVCFKASNASGAQILKGQPVYISGVSGDVPEVNLADADAAAMPSAGLAGETANAGAEILIITFGNLEGVNTSAFSLGDTLYIDTTAGALTATAPAGESAKVQNIGRVIRVHATSGVIKVGGAGRSAATPNLNQDKIFLGDSNNRAVSTALSAVALSSFNNDLGLATVATTGAYSDLSGTPTLGTASALDVGTSASNVVQLDGSARLPAVDGSQLTNLPSASAASETVAGVIEIATNTEAGAGTATDKALVPSNVSSLSLASSQVSGLATVATTGAYSDLSGTPTLGTASALDVGTSASNVVQLDGSARLPAVDGSQLTNLPSGGGFTYSAITADPAPAVKDTHYSCTGTFTITLPAVSGTTAGDQIRVKNIGTGTVTIDGASSETVDGATTFAMDVQWSAVTLVSNGSTGWEIV
jgi:hypothetical protein